VASAVAVAALAAGCGGGDDDSGSKSGSATTAGTTQSVAGTTNPATFSGKPITIYWQAPINTQVANNADSLAGVRAGVRALNAQGGLNGSEVKLSVCDDRDANDELKCVRKAVADKAAAFVGSSQIFNGKAAQAILRKENIPDIAVNLIAQTEWSNPISFPIWTSNLGVIACPVQMTAATGAKRVSTIGQDLPPQKELARLTKGVAAAKAVPYGTNVTVPIAQTDFSGAVKQLADSHPDAIADLLTGPSLIGFFGAARSLGQNFGGYCSMAAILPIPTLKQLKAQADNVYGSWGLPPTNADAAEKYPLVKQFRDEMTAEANAADGDKNASLDKLTTPGMALNAWLGVQAVLKQGAEKVSGPITGAKLLDALNKTTLDLSGAGMQSIDFSKPPAPAVPGYERFFNPMVTLKKWDSSLGDFVENDAPPVNLLTLLAAANKTAG
jgi:branched-chain amino acid transport system substrate-binding protein